MIAFDFSSNPHAFHACLARHNIERVAIGAPDSEWEYKERSNLEFKIIEGHFLENLRKTIFPMTENIPDSADEFVNWFESLADWAPGQHHPLFNWLAHEANLEHLKWFLTQEAAGEAGFEDLVAYTQVKLPVQAKLECARNYWDEMGRGKKGAMHGPLLERMVEELELRPAIETTVWESLALGNTMLGLATTRRYAYHSLGALGAIELTAPGRAEKVAYGMRRLGLSPKVRAYFDLHAALDVLHSRAWIREIIYPLVKENPACAQFLAEGALMRLYCGNLCFERYCNELHLNLPNSFTQGKLPCENPAALLC